MYIISLLAVQFYQSTKITKYSEKRVFIRSGQNKNMCKFSTLRKAISRYFSNFSQLPSCATVTLGSIYDYMYVHTYISAYAGRVSLRGSTTYTLHKDVSHTKTLSHRRMNLQHAVQHQLNVSLTGLHRKKPAGTRGLTHCPYPYDQNQEPKERVYSYLWILETLSSYLHQLRVLVLKCTSAVRTIK